MIKISREDALKLHNDYNIKYGENGISKTLGKSKKRTYYLCETKRNLRCYREIWNKKIKR